MSGLRVLRRGAMKGMLVSTIIVLSGIASAGWTLADSSPATVAAVKTVAIVTFPSDADRKYGDIGPILAGEVQQALEDRSRIKYALLPLDSLPDRTRPRRAPTDLDWEREQAVRLGRSVGADKVIFGRVFSVELGPPAETHRSGGSSVSQEYEANRRPYREVFTCRYTIHEKRNRVRLRVSFGVALCEDGRGLITEDLDQEILDSSTWVDLSGDPQAYPMDLRSAPKTEPVLRPEELARRACKAVGSAIASRAMLELGAPE